MIYQPEIFDPTIYPKYSLWSNQQTLAKSGQCWTVKNNRIKLSSKGCENGSGGFDLEEGSVNNFMDVWKIESGYVYGKQDGEQFQLVANKNFVIQSFGFFEWEISII